MNIFINLIILFLFYFFSISLQLNYFYFYYICHLFLLSHIFFPPLSFSQPNNPVMLAREHNESVGVKAQDSSRTKIKVQNL